ncbi:hypothetical protein EM6_2246 [Asticcacaulis excentricus]|uniref:Uncharacterized protein n=1 Tax=Asticcacaulis excentricus TaxID=78587 RepID=A0A3G9G939_9CAUL|nr:hypothetical protein EM6_2246 [Asticcacaulis excentricus]
MAIINLCEISHNVWIMCAKFHTKWRTAYNINLYISIY